MDGLSNNIPFRVAWLFTNRPPSPPPLVLLWEGSVGFHCTNDLPFHEFILDMAPHNCFTYRFSFTFSYNVTTYIWYKIIFDE
jgi:hypothetical protein